MKKQTTLIVAVLAVAIISLVLQPAVRAQTIQSPSRPIKVYILSGQSNMVGIGQVTGGGTPLTWNVSAQNFM